MSPLDANIVMNMDILLGIVQWLPRNSFKKMLLKKIHLIHGKPPNEEEIWLPRVHQILIKSLYQK